MRPLQVYQDCTPIHLLNDPNFGPSQACRSFLRAGVMCSNKKECPNAQRVMPLRRQKTMDDFDNEGPYTPPKHSRATRMFAARSKSSARGFLTAKLKSETALRQIIFESDLERKTLLVLLAQKTVVNIWDQPPRIEYQDPQGRSKHHVFDYLALLENGAKLAVAVKPAALVERHRFDQTFELIRNQMPARFADEAVLVTEQSYSQAEVRNAELLHMFRAHPDPEADAVVLALLAGMTEDCTIDQVITASGLGGQAFQAAFRAIYDGAVLTDLKRPITPQTVLSPLEDV